jgi:hypothetical protein
MSHKVFISYSTKDADVANAVCKALEAEGVPCWIAPRDILPGEEYADAIIEALNNCQLFLVILSEESNSSPQVRREVERAVSKNLSILTFRIDNTILSKAMEYYLSNRHWLDASQTAFSKQLRSLSAAVQKLLEQPLVPKDETPIPEPLEVIKPGKPITKAMELTHVPVPPSIPVRIHNKNHTIWIIAPILIIILAAVAYFGLAGRSDLPFLSQATTTNTPFLTSTIDYISTMQTYNSISTSMAGDAWIQGFAEPILSQIAGRTADFQDDFSDPNRSSSQWAILNGGNGITFENGKLVIAAANLRQGASITAQASDFVALFKLTWTKTISKTLSIVVSFRGDAFGEASNQFSLNSDGWCGFGATGPTTNNSIVNECKTSISDMGGKAKITIIVQGDQAAAYVNDQPMVGLYGVLHSGNEISIGTSISEGTATVSIDDVEIWYLNK